jgi:hypothetical protein
VQVHGDVSQFTCQTAVAGDDPPAVDQADAEALADVEEGEVGNPPRGAVHLLGQAQGVRLLQKDRLQAQPAAQVLAEGTAVGLVQVRGEDGALLAAVEQSRHADTQPEDRRPGPAQELAGVPGEGGDEAGVARGGGEDADTVRIHLAVKAGQHQLAGAGADDRAKHRGRAAGQV